LCRRAAEIFSVWRGDSYGFDCMSNYT
jgi:hypothetical protein